ncbi:Tem-1-like_protein [Hexamita inflata]|uniref:Tem-1-like protein n=1 Tax=Hexamita inflata TaxID=28002 RepID=A0AA86P8T6_9EUKA|nr:Tem-1-like protein [Hexamita inflata]CAI9932300.1 Tem-1-like protein [Hexamita inflata]CAI9976999.1 Tem-1-like protein [Hexamita inflata]
MADQTIQVKISLYGNAETGKSSLASRYLTGEFNYNYIQTLGVGFREKTISVQNQQVVLSLWDIGGEEEFQQMIPLSADGAHALIFVFDLTQRQSLAGLKNWYRNVRQLNQEGFSIIVGTKYDIFEQTMSAEDKAEILSHARKYAKAMGNAPLIFTSAAKGINVVRLFKLIVSMVFGLNSGIEKVTEVDKPIFEYEEAQ